MFIENLKLKLGLDNQYDIQCGYEAGCLGYSLYNQLTAAGVKCVILAPTTMLTQQGTRIKTDARDARMIAQCLSYGGYHAVYIPTEEDAAVKEYLRMRDDHKLALKKVKQQINAFCLRHGCYYEGTKWTVAHLKWLKKLDLKELYRETLEEYMASYEEQTAKIERFDKRIEEIAAQERYQEKVKRLGCFLGIKTHTALSLIVETGGICKGAVGHKSKALRVRQNGNTVEVIAYADKANTRLRSKYYKMIRHGKKRNVAVAAVARELVCFVWGMMTDNTGIKTA